MAKKNMSMLKNAADDSCAAEIFIAFGANLGPCQATFVQARECLHANGVTVVASSPLYCGAAVGGPPGQPDYFNAVIKVAAVIAPRQLLTLCQRIEERFGRQRGHRWGARTLDLDILAYGQIVCTDNELTLPHPRLHQRRFVLEPLCSLKHDWYHPVLHCQALELLQQLNATPPLRVAAQQW